MNNNVYNNDVSFEWDDQKNAENIMKHGISFTYAQKAFLDPQGLFGPDTKHSGDEVRLYCIGEVDGRILTVRFTMRGDTIRIIGAGAWRRGRKIYETYNR